MHPNGQGPRSASNTDLEINTESKIHYIDIDFWTFF